MVAWINLTLMLLSGFISLYLYLKSVRPAAQEKKIGPKAYLICGRYRLISFIFYFVLIISYVTYPFYPLDIPLLRAFPWPRSVSLAIAAIIAVPSLYLLYRALKDAGQETMLPRKRHRLYGGIYGKIRHPQTVGEVPLWWALAFLLDSPFLAIISFLWIPLFLYICKQEEKDLEIRYGHLYLEYKRRTGAFFPKKKGYNSWQ